MLDIRHGRRRRAAALVAAVFLAATGSLVAASPASAAASDCEHGANGFVDIPDNLGGTVARSITPFPQWTINLEYGTIAGKQRGFARFRGKTVPGDQIWMDWSQNGGPSWMQCGPFTVSSLFAPKTSAAKQTNPSPNWVFRACGRGAGSTRVYCTTWW
jgi:hypothetical protein